MRKIWNTLSSWNPAFGAIIIICASAGLLVLISFGMYKATSSEEKTTQKRGILISDEQKLSAISRAYSTLDRVCLDETRENAALIHFKGQQENDFDGWYWVGEIVFYTFSNNSVTITEIASDRFVKVFPEVAGLKCMEK